MKNNLKTIRKEMGMSQQELANTLGISQEVVSRYEKGRYEIPALFAMQVVYLARTCQVYATLDYLYDITPLPDNLTEFKG